MGSVFDRRTLIQHAGWGYFVLAFVARLPFAMMVVGLLTLTTSVTGSIALGGLASAAAGIGAVVAGPLVGDGVDRLGQRRILVPLGLMNGGMLALFPLVVSLGGGAAAGMIVLVSGLIGATAPQAAAMSRSRIIALIQQRLHPELRDRTFTRAMSYESAADETAFVIGPVLVGVLASFIAPWAPIAIAAALSIVFVSAFALHPTATVTTGNRERGARAPFTSLLRPRILVLVGGTFGVGLFFGSALTSLTAFLERSGEGAQAGLIYGLMGIGSAALALAVAAFPARFTMRWRWIVFAATMTVTAALYAIVGTVSAATLLIILMGLGVGPTLVTIFSLAGARSPEGRSATTMTMLGSALTLAQALAAAVTGAVAESVSIGVAMLFPAAAALLVTVCGLLNAKVGTTASAPLERTNPAVTRTSGVLR